MSDTDETTPCKWCGTPTPSLGTKMCDACWQLDRGILHAPPGALAKMLAATPTLSALTAELTTLRTEVAALVKLLRTDGAADVSGADVGELTMATVTGGQSVMLDCADKLDAILAAHINRADTEEAARG